VSAFKPARSQDLAFRIHAINEWLLSTIAMSVDQYEFLRIGGCWSTINSQLPHLIDVSSNQPFYYSLIKDPQSGKLRPSLATTLSTRGLDGAE
jgi:hypothetical protein